MSLFNQAISAVVQLALFTLIPFIWYIVCNKKCSGFFQWIGLKKTTVFDRTLLKFVVFTIAVFSVTSVGILYSLRGVGTAAGTFSGMGIAGLPSPLKDDCYSATPTNAHPFITSLSL